MITGGYHHSQPQQRGFYRERELITARVNLFTWDHTTLYKQWKQVFVYLPTSHSLTPRLSPGLGCCLRSTSQFCSWSPPTASQSPSYSRHSSEQESICSWQRNCPTHCILIPLEYLEEADGVLQAQPQGDHPGLQSGDQDRKDNWSSFKFNGTTFTKCEQDKNSQKALTWCATEVDKEGEMVQGKWEYCHSGCEEELVEEAESNNST